MKLNSINVTLKTSSFGFGTKETKHPVWNSVVSPKSCKEIKIADKGTHCAGLQV